MSGYLVHFGNGTLDWYSGRQTITAPSTTEAEIYATDECTKKLLHVNLILEDLHRQEILPPKTKLHNDNSAGVTWSKNTTTKGLRYMTIRENAVRESVKNDFIDVVHIAGRVNPSDMFTKEHKDVQHFCNLRDSVLTLLPPEITTFPVNSTQSTTYKTCDYIDSQNPSSDFIAAARMGGFHIRPLYS